MNQLSQRICYLIAKLSATNSITPEERSLLLEISQQVLNLEHELLVAINKCCHEQKPCQHYADTDGGDKIGLNSLRDKKGYIRQPDWAKGKPRK